MTPCVTLSPLASLRAGSAKGLLLALPEKSRSFAREFTAECTGGTAQDDIHPPCGLNAVRGRLWTLAVGGAINRRFAGKGIKGTLRALLL